VCEHPEDPHREEREELNRELNEAAEESREEPDSLAEHVHETVTDVQRLLNEAARYELQPASWLEQAVTTMPILPLEYYSSGSGLSTPRISAMRTRLSGRLAGLAGAGTDAVDLRSLARAKFVAVVLGIRGIPEVSVTQAADGILDRLRLSLAAGDDSGLATVWRDTEYRFWRSLAAATRTSPNLTASRVDHLAWMGLVCELSPLDADFGWERPRDQQQLVDRLIAAAGEEYDIAAVYTQAADLLYNDEPLPRAVTAELVQLALANLAEVNIDRATRLSVLEVETPKPDTTGMSCLDTAAARELWSAREKLRDNANTLHTEPPPGTSYQDVQRALRAEAYRFNLRELWTTALSRIGAAIDRGDDAQARKATFDGLVGDASLPGLLEAWSASIAADPPDLVALSRTSNDLVAEIDRLQKAHAAAYPDTLASWSIPEKPLELVLVDIGNELEVESADLLSDHWVQAHELDGVRFEIRSRRSGANLLAQARLAVQGRATIVPFVTGAIKDAAKVVKGKVDGTKLEDAEWLSAVGLSGDVVIRSLAAGDGNQLVKPAANLVEVMNMARAETAAKLRDQRAASNAVTRMLDAVSLSLGERIDAVLDDADPDVLQSSLPESLGELRERVQPVQLLADPADSWSTGKKLLLAALPSDDQRKTLNNVVFTGEFSAKLESWAKEATRKNVDRASLLRQTWTVVELLRAYRVGIDNTVTDPVIRAGFQDLLDQISATIDIRLAKLDGVAPPLM